MSGNDSFDGPPPRPSPPKRKPEPLVIDAKANEGRTFSQEGFGARLSVGALGGLIGASLALAGAWLWAGPLDARLTAVEARAGAADAGAARLDALESDARSAASTRQSLAARLSAAEAKLSEAEAQLGQGLAASAADRKGAALGVKTSLEPLQRHLAELSEAEAADRAALADAATRLARASEAGQNLERRLAALESEAVSVAAEAQAAKAAADRAIATAAKPDAPPQWASLKARLDRLEGGAAGAGAAQALAAAGQAEASQQTAALKMRLDRLETAAAAPKSETRAAPSVTVDAADAQTPARAVAAMALSRRLDASEPFKPELAALERLGASPSALAALRPFADTGAPTPAALAQGFHALKPRLADPAAAKDPAAKLLGEVEGLVKIRKLGENREADVERGVAQIADALAAADLPRALALLGLLPPAAREAAHDWEQAVAARLAADRAAEALLGRAVADLGAGR